jgi:hypothetical protein
MSECDHVKINNFDTCCEQVGRRGKDCETKRNKEGIERRRKLITMVIQYCTHIPVIPSFRIGGAIPLFPPPLLRLCLYGLERGDITVYIQQ